MPDPFLGLSQANIVTAQNVLRAIQDNARVSTHRAAGLLMTCVDARIRRYRYRMVVFDDLGDLVGDTNPELPVAEGSYPPGEITADGLHDLARGCAETVLARFTCLDYAAILNEFEARIPSLRISLSRNGGASGTWNVPLSVYDRPYRARVTVAPSATIR